MSKISITIIDYGSGNLRSAAKAFEKISHDEGLDCTVKVSSRPEDLDQASHLVLPGQGAFNDCMQGLQGSGLIEALERNVLEKGKPFLGICVGMQLLASRGLEGGVTQGLNWIGGEVVPMQPRDPALKIPHMGWNILQTQSDDTPQDNQHFVLRHVRPDTHFYFVHSYMFQCENPRHILAQTDYGGLVPAVVGRDNIIGAQFHPEKSHDCGLRFIGNFMAWNP